MDFLAILIQELNMQKKIIYSCDSTNKIKGDGKNIFYLNNYKFWKLEYF